MGVLRKEGAALGLASNDGSHGAAKAVKRAVVGANHQGKPRKRLGGMRSDAPRYEGEASNSYPIYGRFH